MFQSNRGKRDHCSKQTKASMVDVLLRTDWALAHESLKFEVGPGFVLMSPDSKINKDILEHECTVGRMLIREWFGGREK